MIRRRQLLSAAAIAPLARPAIVRAESARVLTFIPQCSASLKDMPEGFPIFWNVRRT